MFWSEHVKNLNSMPDKELLKILTNPVSRINNLYPITNKKGQFVKFVMNKPQARVLSSIMAGKYPVVLKSRQVGITSIFRIYGLDKILYNKGRRFGIQAHKQDSLESIFKNLRDCFDHCHYPFRNRGKSKRDIDTKKIISLEHIDSEISASLEVRSRNLTELHESESAFIEKARQIATSGSLSSEAFRSKETTADGFNHFYDFWQAVKRGDHGAYSNYELIFISWLDDTTCFLPVHSVDEQKEIKETLDEEEKNLIKIYPDITYEQLKWRREKVFEMGIEYFKQEYPSNDNECFVSSTVKFCDQSRLVFMRETSPKPITTYNDLNMRVKIYEELRDDLDYVIGLDPAEGLKKRGDYTAMQILALEPDADRPIRQVGVARGHASPVETCNFVINFVRRHFDDYEPLLVVERNNHGHAVLNNFLYNQELRYGRLYYQVDPDRNDSKPGFLTTSISKVNMIRNLFSQISDKSLWINDPETIDEIFTLTSESGTKIEAEEGKYDDLFMSLALANHGINFIMKLTMQGDMKIRNIET